MADEGSVKTCDTDEGATPGGRGRPRRIWTDLSSEMLTLKDISNELRVMVINSVQWRHYI